MQTQMHFTDTDTFPYPKSAAEAPKSGSCWSKPEHVLASRSKPSQNLCPISSSMRVLRCWSYTHNHTLPARRFNNFRRTSIMQLLGCWCQAHSHTLPATHSSNLWPTSHQLVCTEALLLHTVLCSVKQSSPPPPTKYNRLSCKFSYFFFLIFLIPPPPPHLSITDCLVSSAIFEEEISVVSILPWVQLSKLNTLSYSQ